MSERKIKTPRKIRKNEQPKEEFVPYEEKFEINPLTLTITIVNKGQGYAIEDMLHSYGCAMAFSCRGQGTATAAMIHNLGLSENRKRVVFGVLREDRWEEYAASLAKRFAISDVAKGVACKCDISAVAGVSIYKMLSNIRELPKPKKKLSKKKQEGEPMEEVSKKANVGYENIIAIVNSGYTDLVMNAAREAGARGGTIISGRGTGNKDIEKFYGIEISPEKEVVMILVPNSIKDDVMLAINKQAGMDTMGHGIAFSLPVSGLVGISLPGSETEESK